LARRRCGGGATGRDGQGAERYQRCAGEGSDGSAASHVALSVGEHRQSQRCSQRPDQARGYRRYRVWSGLGELLLGRSLPPAEPLPIPRVWTAAGSLLAVSEVLLIALGQRMQRLQVGGHSLLAVGRCTVGGSVIGEIDRADRYSSHIVAVANDAEPAAGLKPNGSASPPAKSVGIHFADRADQPKPDQNPRAAGLVCAPGWSTCCVSWWRDLTPSLRNALRRW
jgi:hypothetical protein